VYLHYRDINSCRVKVCVILQAIIGVVAFCSWNRHTHYKTTIIAVKSRCLSHI